MQLRKNMELGMEIGNYDTRYKGITNGVFLVNKAVFFSIHPFFLYTIDDFPPRHIFPDTKNF